LLISIENASSTSVQLSSSRGNSANFDEITTSDGNKCRQSMGSNLNAEIGVVGLGQNTAQKAEDYIVDAPQAGVFARLSYAIGAPKRLDCSRIYEMELEKLRHQLRVLQQQ
jgi:hypothetical protein